MFNVSLVYSFKKMTGKYGAPKRFLILTTKNNANF